MKTTNQNGFEKHSWNASFRHHDESSYTPHALKASLASAGTYVQFPALPADFNASAPCPTHAPTAARTPTATRAFTASKAPTAPTAFGRQGDRSEFPRRPSPPPSPSPLLHLAPETVSHPTCLTAAAEVRRCGAFQYNHCSLSPWSLVFPDLHIPKTVLIQGR